MEFFEWVSAIQAGFAVTQGGVTLEQLYICFGIAGGVMLLCLILGGIALQTMAKKQNVKNAWLGYLPFANTYFAGKIAGEASFFGQRMKRVGLYAMLAEIVYAGLNVLHIVIIILLSPYLIPIKQDAGVTYRYEGVPDTLNWALTAETPVYALSYIFQIVQFVFFFVLFVALFRKYYARGPFLMTFLCAFLPLRAFVLFAVRNNAPVDFNSYMRRRAEEYVRQQQQYGNMGGQGGYNPPNGNYNPPNGGYNPPPSDDPFSEFGSSGNAGNSSSSGGSAGSSGGNDDPFSEFGGSDGNN